MKAVGDLPFLPYGRQTVDEDDIREVIEVLKSDWLTTGPKVEEFEATFAESVGAECAVAVNSGTAALHCAMYALGVGPGDEVVVPPMTFAATANCVVFQGATPVFADVTPGTLLLDPARVDACINPRTKAILCVDYAGQPCDYDVLGEIARSHGIPLVADACHSLGGGYKGRPVGTLADISVFSFHPVKHITTGEGGMLTTNHPSLATRARNFRNHGISGDARRRSENGSWYYEMTDLGFNYRLTDFQCALGISQLSKLRGFVLQRQVLAGHYHRGFSLIPEITPLLVRPEVSHAYHLYVVALDQDRLSADRNKIFAALRAQGIGVNVHYIPVHLHPYYRQRFGTGPGMCPVAETSYERILSLPIFPAMSPGDVETVVDRVGDLVDRYRHPSAQQ
ncbi:MAG TPA: UDP-4-amino-4,6-dideoxy-N-acetyl-beta-L-altrosamine transaminase [Syntrophobacteraceae bacterium]|nr:UDP-4-amino-4,6-dideoxy-N-acetyl-beta-L-altrosamine transaminase [Syntrophobacteraceae bacterium]